MQLLQSIPKSYIEESLLFERKRQKKQIEFKLWQHANNGGQPLHFGHGYGICFAPLLGCSDSAHISVPGVWKWAQTQMAVLQLHTSKT